MNTDTLQTVSRSILKIGAGYFVAKGFTDDNTAQIIIGGITALIGVVWGIFHRNPAPGQSQPVPIKQLAVSALALGAVFASGCVNQAIQRGDIVSIKERTFGITIAQSPANQSPEIKLGFNSFVIEMIPTSTNAIVSAPRFVDTFDLKQGLNPFGTGIQEDTGAGDVMIGTNGYTRALNLDASHSITNSP